MTAVFNVHVPFEAFAQETLEARTHAQLPDTDLTAGLRVRRVGGSYEADLEVSAPNRRAAKAAAVQRVESLLKILAASNDGFRVIMSDVRAEGVTEDDEPPAEQPMIGGLAIRVTDSISFEEHLDVVKGKASLARRRSPSGSRRSAGLRPQLPRSQLSPRDLRSPTGAVAPRGNRPPGADGGSAGAAATTDRIAAACR